MGFPIQRSPDLSLFSGSPKLIAACHVFHRLLAPRHPPYALSSLTIKLITYKITVLVQVQVFYLNLNLGLNLLISVSMPSSLHPYSIVKEQCISDSSTALYQLFKLKRVKTKSGDQTLHPLFGGDERI